MHLDDSSYELDRRSGDGLEVRLVRYAASNRLVVEVFDDVAEQMFTLDVTPECARDAFANPYAYAPLDVVLRASKREAAWTRPDRIGTCSCSRRALAPATRAAA